MADTSTATDDRLAARLEAQRSRKSPGSTSDSKSGGRFSARAQRWMRWAHVYLSMAAFAIIGFFGATGLLLNHPGWLGGEELVTTLEAGTLPESVRAGDEVEFLLVSEFLRSEHGVVGEVTNFDQVGNEGSINYTGPAYGASARFDVVTLEYSLRVTEENLVNAMRDLHTGSDTNVVWDLAIDASAVLLLVVSVTGLGIQLFMRKRRARALGWLVLGAAISALLVWFTLV